MTAKRTISTGALELARAETGKRADAVATIRKQSKEHPKLLAAYQELSSTASECAQGGLIFAWRLGFHAYESHSGKPKYGTAAIELLSGALGVDDATVYKCIHLAKMWESEEAFREQVVDRTMPNGEPIGVSLLYEIIKLPEDPDDTEDMHKARRELLEQVYDEGLTLRALIAEIGSRIPPRASSTRTGSPASKAAPKTQLGAFSQMAEAAAKISERVADVRKDLLGPLLDSEAGATVLGRKVVVLKKLAETKEALTSMSYEAASAAQELDTLMEKMAYKN